MICTQYVSFFFLFSPPPPTEFWILFYSYTLGLLLDQVLSYKEDMVQATFPVISYVIYDLLMAYVIYIPLMAYPLGYSISSIKSRDL